MARKSAKKGCCSNLMMILMIACVVLSLATLVMVSYDKFVKEKETTIVNK